ncbi:MAG: sirohydrochlorin chelatase [Planctomycetota bacterium]|jgi:sirohydrochlorin cobaltochelatase
MVIFIAHGSRDARWRASVEAVVDSVQADLGEVKARLAYMDCAPPTLMDVAADAVREGATDIRVVPLFLTEQGHVDRDIRPKVEQLRVRYPNLDVELLPPVGQHALFGAMLREIALSS